tara:strand:+ start:135 stop:1100 length:966 start_codon:yes stop_codon:yes gene_type:complete
MTHALTAATLVSDVRHTRKLSLGCPTLDAALGGGFDVQGLTEVAGEAGVGKTQLVLRCLLQAQLPPAYGGLSGGALLLHTEGSSGPSMKRLQQLAASFAQRYGHLGADAQQLMQNVFAKDVDQPEVLMQILNEAVPELLRTRTLRLLIIDSIAALFRSDDKPDDPYGRVDRAAELADRSRAMVAMAARLKQLSHQYDLTVIVTNQVTDKPAEAIDFRSVAPWERGASLAEGSLHEGLRLPALGLSWANCVNTRILLSRRSRLAAPASCDAQSPWSTEAPTGALPVVEAAETVRKLAVCWSPRLPHASVRFEIHGDGVRGCE